VYHKWICDTETVNTFCMRVYGCFVDDGKGDRVDLLDAQGCAQDKYLLGNLEYPTDLMAGKEAHVFKYADRVALFFQCQIAISIKEGTDCPKPTCPEPAKGKKRSADHSAPNHKVDAAASLDVLAELTALDLEDSKNARLPDSAVDHSAPICLSTVSFGLLMAVGLLLTAATLTVVVLSCLVRRRRDDKLGAEA